MRKTVNLIEQEDALLGRTCSLEPASKSATGFQIVKHGKATKIETAIAINETGGKTIAEYHIPLTLDALRAIDSNKDKLKKFLDSRLPRIKTNSSVNIMLVKLVIEGVQQIEDKDIDYLWDMLQVSGNDIIVTPFIEYPKGTTDEITKYSSFVKNFIMRSNSSYHERMACSIPYSASRGNVDDLVKLYSDVSPQIFVLDFGGKKPFDTIQEMTMSALLRAAQKTTKEHGYDYYLYGYDVKPFQSSPEAIVAQNIMLAGAGFNAVGPRHTVPPLKPEILIKLAALKPNPMDRIRVFEGSDYGYHKISDASVKEKFVEWTKLNKSGLDVNMLEKPENDGMTRSLSKVYSYAGLVPTAKEIDIGIKEDTLKNSLDSRVLPRDIIKRIEKMKKSVN